MRDMTNDGINEICALGDAAHALLNRLRVMDRVAPDAERLRCGVTFRDSTGRWWVIGAELCASETEAGILADRLNDE